MPALSFITNGPYWATGSPMGRPWRSRASTGSSPGRQLDRLAGLDAGAGASAEDVAGDVEAARPRTRRACGRSPARRGGRIQEAPGSKRRCQMATSVSVRLAQDRGGGGGGCSPASAPGDHGDLDGSALGVGGHDPGDVLVPQHREVGVDQLVLAGQVQPDLEQLERVVGLLLDQGEHLGVDDAAAGGQPLDVAPAEAGGGAEGVGVVDVAPADIGHRLEAAVGVLGEAGHDQAVVHAPAVLAREVHAEVPPVERGLRGHALVAGGDRRRRGGRRTGTGRWSATAQRRAPPFG